MTKDEALKLARTALGVQLDAMLGKAGHLRNDDRKRYAENGIKAIDEALAQPEQESVAWMSEHRFDELRQGFTVMTTLTKQRAFEDDVALYTTPLQRKPLTNNEIRAILDDPNIAERHEGNWLVLPYTFARAIEAAHQIYEDKK